jgi:hypothetical protein
MKRRLSIVLIGLLLASTAFGQSVTITPKTVVYRRPKPMMDFQKEFSVTYPKVGGVSRRLAAKIEMSISYRNVMKLDVRDELGDYQWLDEATYEVQYNKRGILGVFLSLSGTGAYTSSYGKNVIVDLKTGNRATPATVFVGLDRIVALCRKRQEEEIRSAQASIEREQPDFAESAKEIFKYANFVKLNLDWFILDDDGVTFVYDYGFPHIAEALEPGGRYFFSWAEIKPYIRRTGLLGKFIR